MGIVITRGRTGARSLQTTLWLPCSIREVFAFFGDAFNLEALTPPFLHFEVLTPPPIRMGPGTLIDYRLRLHGVPLRWQTEITAWNPPHRFVDEQRRGPYRLWVHEHTFESRSGGTAVQDRVRYAHAGGPLIHGLFVARDLRRIFTYRQERLQWLLCGSVPPVGPLHGARYNEARSRVDGEGE
jgi:ligand-binding SRPBCC domain-containing protein